MVTKWQCCRLTSNSHLPWMCLSLKSHCNMVTIFYQSPSPGWGFSLFSLILWGQQTKSQVHIYGQRSTRQNFCSTPLTSQLSLSLDFWLLITIYLSTWLIDAFRKLKKIFLSVLESSKKTDLIKLSFQQKYPCYRY